MLPLETMSGPLMLPDSKKLEKQRNTDGMKICFEHKICARYEDIGTYMVNTYAAHSPASQQTDIPSHMYQKEE